MDPKKLLLAGQLLIQLAAGAVGQPLTAGPSDLDGWSSCQLQYKYPATRYRMFGASESSLTDLTPKNCYHLMVADGSACQRNEWSRPDFAVLLMQRDDGTLRLKIVTSSETIEADRRQTSAELQLFVDGLLFPLNSSRPGTENFCAIVPANNGTVVVLQHPAIWIKFDGSSLDVRLRRPGASTDACGRCDPAGRVVREEHTIDLLYRNGWLADESAACRRGNPVRPIIWNEDRADDERLSSKCDVNATQPLRPFNRNETSALTLPANGCYAVLAADVGGCGRGFVEKPSYVILARLSADKQIQITLKVIESGEILTVNRYRTPKEPLKLNSERTTLKDGKFEHSQLQVTAYQSHYDIYGSEFFIRFDGQRIQLRLFRPADGPAACGACFGGDSSATRIIRGWLTRSDALEDQPAGCMSEEELSRVLDVTAVPSQDVTPQSRQIPVVYAHLIEIEPERVCSSVWPEHTCIEPYRPVYPPVRPFYNPGRQIQYNNSVSFRCYNRSSDPDAERLIGLAGRLRAAFELRYRNKTADLHELNAEVVAIRLIADEIDVTAARRDHAASYKKIVPTPSYCIPPGEDANDNE